MSSVVVSVIGFVGALLILFAYFQVSRRKWSGTSRQFHITNAIAAALLVYYGWTTHAYANILLNAVWLLIALSALKHAKHKGY